MTATPDGKGYWLVAADGGVFAFGDAGYFGSLGGSPRSVPVIGLVVTPVCPGYTLVDANGRTTHFGS